MSVYGVLSCLLVQGTFSDRGDGPSQTKAMNVARTDRRMLESRQHTNTSRLHLNALLSVELELLCSHSCNVYLAATRNVTNVNLMCEVPTLLVPTTAIVNEEASTSRRIG